MNNLSLTAVIPVRNGASTVANAAKSAFTAGCNEILLFDDASDDDTSLELYMLEKKHHSMVRTFSISTHFRNGVNFARNFLIEQAQDGLIICLDADDTLRDITPLREAYEPNTFVYGDYMEYNGDSETIIKGIPAGSLARKNITGVTFIFHKSDWQRAGGYDPDFAYAEDYGFQCALVQAGVKPKYVDTLIYNRYLHPTGNERTAKAGVYWSFYRDMARNKYPAVFVGTG